MCASVLRQKIEGNFISLPLSHLVSISLQIAATHHFRRSSPITTTLNVNKIIITKTFNVRLRMMILCMPPNLLCQWENDEEDYSKD